MGEPESADLRAEAVQATALPQRPSHPAANLAQQISRFIPVSILGRRYDVPEGLTIQKALEWAGFKLTRGCGCRGGFCGACATVYRVAEDHRLQVGLACQVVALPDMYLTVLPFYPAQKAIYDLEAIKRPARAALELYPELARCYGCATCNKACPQHLDVMGYVAAMLRGDLQKAAELSFDCVMCGLCASRCPAEIAQYNAALYARRAYAKLTLTKPKPLADRIAEIQAGKYDRDVAELAALDAGALKKIYVSRDMEVP